MVNNETLKELLALKLFLIEQLNKGNFTVHPLDVLQRLNKVLDHVD